MSDRLEAVIRCDHGFLRDHWEMTGKICEQRRAVLVKTQPDYEAAAKYAFDRWQGEANESGDWDLDLSKIERRVWIAEAKSSVDAAVGDLWEIQDQ